MPTIGEIITDIDIRLPNVFTTDQKLVWANEVIKKIYKYMNKKEQYPIITIENEAFYPLPSNCTMDEIVSVIRSNDITITENTTYSEYTYKGLNENLTGNNYYDGLNGLIGVYPIPNTSGYTFNIVYEKKPALLSSSDLTATPDINENYHGLITFYVLSVIASSGNNPDIDLVNNFRADYNKEWDMMFKDYIETKIKTPTKSRSNRWWGS